MKKDKQLIVNTCKQLRDLQDRTGLEYAVAFIQTPFDNKELFTRYILTNSVIEADQWIEHIQEKYSEINMPVAIYLNHDLRVDTLNIAQYCIED